MVHRTRAVFLPALVLGALACAGADGAPAWGTDLPQGPHPVGFRTQRLQRASVEGGERTLTLAVWYPAQPGSRAPALTLDDLLGLALAEGQLEEAAGLAPPRALAAALTGDSLALSVETARSALALRTRSTRDADAAPGPFPLVIWGVRHATVLAQAPLSEVLASHGFVVATVWSADPPLAFLWDDHPPEAKIATLDAHAADLRHALATLRANAAVAGDRVVALAWSYGGQTVSRLQESDDAVRVVIALDANVLPDRVEERLDARRPLVAFVGRDTANRGLGRLDTLGVPWIEVRLPDLRHGHFNALEGYLPATFGAETAFAWSSADDTALRGYRALARAATMLARAFAGEDLPTMPALADSLRATPTARVRYGGVTRTGEDIER